MYVNELIKTREGKHNDENFRLPTPKHWGKRDDHIHIQRRILKQAGTGPSRRHIQGSKIAKRLPSVKYSFTVVETRKFFENFFFEKITY